MHWLVIRPPLYPADYDVACCFISFVVFHGADRWPKIFSFWSKFSTYVGWSCVLFLKGIHCSFCCKSCVMLDCFVLSVLGCRMVVHILSLKICSLFIPSYFMSCDSSKLEFWPEHQSHLLWLDWTIANLHIGMKMCLICFFHKLINFVFGSKQNLQFYYSAQQ